LAALAELPALASNEESYVKSKERLPAAAGAGAISDVTERRATNQEE